MSRLRRPFRLIASFSTETTTIGDGASKVSFAHAFSFLTWENIEDMREYEPARARLGIVRSEEAAMERIEEIIKLGETSGRIPIVAGYGIMLDLQPLMQRLNDAYELDVLARSAGSVYVLDLLGEDGGKLLRFWDMSNLDGRGMQAMARDAGHGLLPPIDRGKPRHPGTPFTDDEMKAIRSELETMPLYIRSFLERQPWISSDDMGSSIMTLTGVPRKWARTFIAPLRFTRSDGRTSTLGRAFDAQCMSERARTFKQYALRKACYRSGWAFTAAATAHRVMTNIHAIDENSSYHAFICGKFFPDRFERTDETPSIIAYGCDVIEHTDALANYAKPWTVAFHALMRFHNVRLRAGSCFEKYEFGLLSEQRFYSALRRTAGADERNVRAEERIRAEAFHDTAIGAEFAYSKLMRADSCDVFVTEIEFACMAQVYEWDSFEILDGEHATRFSRVPDYIALQSMRFYREKERIKRDPDRDEAAYRMVKAQLNSIYGAQAMDDHRPSYIVDEAGNMVIDETSVATPANFDDMEKKPHGVYTLGIRIAGWSRYHLVTACRLIWESLGTRSIITSGDTDSLKISLDVGLGEPDIMEALRPLHDATAQAVRWHSERVRREFPGMATDMTACGRFQLENIYPLGMEFWAKGRAFIDADGGAHVTMAGIPQPGNEANLAYALTCMMADGYTFGESCGRLFGWNTFVDHPLSHNLEVSQPSADDTVELGLYDYLGVPMDIKGHQAATVSEVGQSIGDISLIQNQHTLDYQLRRGREMPGAMHELDVLPYCIIGTDIYRHGFPVVKDFLNGQIVV